MANVKKTIYANDFPTLFPVTIALELCTQYTLSQSAWSAKEILSVPAGLY